MKSTSGRAVLQSITSWITTTRAVMEVDLGIEPVGGKWIQLERGVRGQLPRPRDGLPMLNINYAQDQPTAIAKLRSQLC